MTSGPDLEDNLDQAAKLIREAAKQGATFIATPENTCRMRAKVEDKFASAWDEKQHPGLDFFVKLAKELTVTLLLGSLSSVKLGDGRLANRSFLILPDGEIAARYDKIHMFDVSLENGEVYKESATHAPGRDAVIADLPFAKLGLTICYDVRFAALYRALAQFGAEIIAVPAAFTVPTGKAHWETLLRARAIETGAYIIAPAQCGMHEGGRGTWGHSMIISPWGEILAEAGDTPCVITADFDAARVKEARSAVPSLTHDREFSAP